MVALSFQKEFRQPILDRVKRHTLRDRASRFQIGCTLHLYTGMRTQYCKAIGIATCVSIIPTRLDLEHGRVEYLETGHALTMIDQLDAFAASDGFPEGWRNGLMKFWAKHHPSKRVWDGYKIGWGETLVPAADA